MKKTLIGVIVVAAALSLGVGVAFGASRALNSGSPAASNQAPASPSATSFPPQTGAGNYDLGPGMMGTYDAAPGGAGINNYDGMGPGMMGAYGTYDQSSTGQRITLDQALQQVQSYVTSAGSNFEVAEIMEFSNNFYAAVLEKDTGKGAFELLVDPFSGDVFPEYGPNMMWNVKYGTMGNGSSPQNTLSFDQAHADAQKALDAQVPGAQVEPDGYTFYGYYTFDYKVDGQIAGMLSVNGFDGQTWLHTWHGQFITEKELLQ